MKSMIAVLLVFVTGCASIIAPGPDRIMVASNPPGASVYLDGCYVAETPGIIRVDRASDGILTIRKDGYSPFGWQIDKPVNGWFFGNIAFGFFGIIGMIADGAAGNITKYSTDPINASLKPLQSVCIE